MAFIQAGGTVVRKELNNETLRVDTGCLVGFSEGISYDIELTKGMKSMLLGGEGLWLATLSGTGSVWIQSLPFSRLADRIIAAAPELGGSRQGKVNVWPFVKISVQACGYRTGERNHTQIMTFAEYRYIFVFIFLRHPDVRSNVTK